MFSAIASMYNLGVNDVKGVVLMIPVKFVKRHDMGKDGYAFHKHVVKGVTNWPKIRGKGTWECLAVGDRIGLITLECLMGEMILNLRKEMASACMVTTPPSSDDSHSHLSSYQSWRVFLQSNS